MFLNLKMRKGRFGPTPLNDFPSMEDAFNTAIDEGGGGEKDEKDEDQDDKDDSTLEDEKDDDSKDDPEDKISDPEDSSEEIYTEDELSELLENDNIGWEDIDANRLSPEMRLLQKTLTSGWHKSLNKAHAKQNAEFQTRMDKLQGIVSDAVAESGEKVDPEALSQLLLEDPAKFVEELKSLVSPKGGKEGDSMLTADEIQLSTQNALISLADEVGADVLKAAIPDMESIAEENPGILDASKAMNNTMRAATLRGFFLESQFRKFPERIKAERADAVKAYKVSVKKRADSKDSTKKSTSSDKVDKGLPELPTLDQAFDAAFGKESAN